MRFNRPETLANHATAGHGTIPEHPDGMMVDRPQPVRVLFVDDEPAILNAVKRLFRREPYDIETAPDGATGIEVFRRFRPMVVVSDHRMPGMTGVEFLTHIRAIDPEPVRVVLTGCTDLPAAEAAINEGEVWRFLTKPWNDEDLRSTMAAAAERFRLVAENRLLLDKLASIGLLAGGVAHELNNPIGGILAFSQMIQKELPADSQIASDLKQIEHAAHRCKRIVSDLLDFARSSRNAPRRVLSVDDAIEKAVVLARFQTRGEVDIVRAGQDGGKGEAGAPEVAPVFGDPNRIEQVILNLLSNAIQAITTAKGRGRIEIRTFQEREHVCISIADDGPGIPEDLRERIFDAFYTTKNAGEGTGLGLTISQGIVRDHNGTIDVASTVGRGTTFTIRLPAIRINDRAGAAVAEGIA